MWHFSFARAQNLRHYTQHLRRCASLHAWIVQTGRPLLAARAVQAELKGLNQKTMHIFEPVQVASQVADRGPGQAAELDKLEPMGSGQSHCNTMSSTQVSSCIWSSSTDSLHTLHLLHELLHTRPAMIHRRAVLKRLATHAALPRPSGLTGLQVIA